LEGVGAQGLVGGGDGASGLVGYWGEVAGESGGGEVGAVGDLFPGQGAAGDVDVSGAGEPVQGEAVPPGDVGHRGDGPVEGFREGAVEASRAGAARRCEAPYVLCRSHAGCGSRLRAA